MTHPKPIPFNPQNASDSLAQEIAIAFQDETRLPLYRQICSAHTHAVVYRAYRQVLQTPLRKIKKSRLAYLIYLLRKYDAQV